MPSFTDKSENTKVQEAVNESASQSNDTTPLFQFADGRAETASQQSMQAIMNGGVLTTQLITNQDVIQRNGEGKQIQEAITGRQNTDEESIRAKNNWGKLRRRLGPVFRKMKGLKLNYEHEHKVKLPESGQGQGEGNPIGGSYLASQVGSKERVYPATSIYGEKTEEGSVHKKMLAPFLKEGAHAFITVWADERIRGRVKDDNFKGWGVDANFVGLKEDADRIIKEESDPLTGRGLFGLEKRYGIPETSWVWGCAPSFKIYRYMVKPDNLTKLGIRLPAGDEWGADGTRIKDGRLIKGKWVPGGRTEDGLQEAVIDPTYRQDTAKDDKPKITDFVEIELEDKLVEATKNTIKREKRDPKTFEIEFLKPEIEERIVNDKTQKRVFDGKKMNKPFFGGHTYSRGEKVLIDNNDIKSEGETDIGRNNLFVKIAGTKDEYIKLTKLSMHLPNTEEEASLPNGEADSDSKSIIEDLLKVETRNFKEKGKDLQEDLSEIDFRDRSKKGFLDSKEVKAINKLSSTKIGRAFLREKGFLNKDEIERWARDPKIADLWERYETHGVKHVANLPVPFIPKVEGASVLSHIHRIQIATRQQELGIKYDRFKNTAGYNRYLAKELESGSEEARREIYRRDTETWKRTLDFDIENLKDIRDPEAKRLDTITQTASALGVLQRVFLILHDGLQYRDDQKEKLEKDWKEDVGVALSHGGRVEIILPPSKGAYEHSFMDWLLGGVESDKSGSQSESKKAAGIDRRPASSHNATRNKEGNVTEHKQNTLAVPFPHWVNLKKIAIDANAQHLGMDLPIGGLGNIDMAGGTVLPDGRHGHMYIYYKPPSTEKPGVLLIGIETSRMERTDVFGQYHDSRGAPAEFSSVGTAKKARIGNEFGGRVVDYTADGRPSDWLIKLKEAEKRINEGFEKSREEVLKRLVGRPEKRQDQSLADFFKQ